MRAGHRVVPGAATFLVVAVVLAGAFADNAALADACYLSVMVGAGIAAWLGALRADAGQRLAPALIAAGVSCSALGEVAWIALDAAGAGTDVSLADPLWFASYGFLIGAMWVVLKRSRPDGRTDVGFVLDAVTIGVVCVLVFWRMSVDAIVADSSVGAGVRIVWASYPIMDAVLLALVIRVLLSRSARAAIDAWFAVGVCLWLAADIAFLQWPEDELALSLMDAAWMTAAVLLARAAWRVREVRPASDRDATSGWVAQMLIAVCPLLIPPGLELVADLRGEPDQPAQLFVGMALVIALAFVRTGRLLRSEQGALRELEHARDEALAASDAKSAFLANISHEIRTPLTTILATAELLEDTRIDDLQRTLLGRMDRSGRQLRALVESILDFSLIESGNAELHAAELDLHALVDDVLDAHRPRAASRGLLLECDLPPDLRPVVVGDATRVFQVVSNLVDNALKFTDSGEVRLLVRVDPADDFVEFVVRDTGIGIRPEDQELVFESFRQVDGSTTRKAGGSGLGLAICRELTELMGGTLTVDSQLGRGSTFRARIPLPAAT
ncbi:MAG: ATP-binding protein [Aeromicrobium sp.]